MDFCIQTKVIKPHKVIFPVCTCKMYMSVCGLYGLSAARCWLWYEDDDDDERRLLLTDSALVSVLVARPEEETEKEKVSDHGKTLYSEIEQLGRHARKMRLLGMLLRLPVR